MKEEEKERGGESWVGLIRYYTLAKLCLCVCVHVRVWMCVESMLSVSVPGVYVEVRREPQVPALMFPVACDKSLCCSLP